MKEFIDKTVAFIKANLLISILIGFAIVVIFFGKQLKRIFFGTRRIKHRKAAPALRRVTRRRRQLPRSVGLYKRNKPAVAYNKNGSRKKPWQIAGSPAARRHMAQIRARR